VGKRARERDVIDIGRRELRDLQTGGDGGFG
jgi:hypothetical protein